MIVLILVCSEMTSFYLQLWGVNFHIAELYTSLLLSHVQKVPSSLAPGAHCWDAHGRYSALLSANDFALWMLVRLFPCFTRKNLQQLYQGKPRWFPFHFMSLELVVFPNLWFEVFHQFMMNTAFSSKWDCVLFSLVFPDSSLSASSLKRSSSLSSAAVNTSLNPPIIVFVTVGVFLNTCLCACVCGILMSFPVIGR